jgi:hypothetical protein
MGTNPLDPGSAAGRPDRDVDRGHGTRALGPSDSSDSGSDVAGGLPERLQDLAEQRPDAADIDADRIEAVPEDLEDEDADEE